MFDFLKKFKKECVNTCEQLEKAELENENQVKAEKPIVAVIDGFLYNTSKADRHNHQYGLIQKKRCLIGRIEMLKCKVCGTEFPAIKERHYVARDNGKTGLSSAFGLNDEEKIYDSFDCPMCGCQVVVQDRKRLYSTEKKENEKE